MFLATFVVTIYDIDLETERSDISHVEVGSTEINEADLFKALNIARDQANLIVDGLKASGFSNLTRQDCQIHIRPASLQYIFDQWTLRPGYYETISGQKVYGLFIDDPRNNLATLHTASAPKGVKRPHIPKEVHPNGTFVYQ